MTPRIETIKKRIGDVLAVAKRRHRGDENARRVVQGISDGIDGLLRSIFAEDLFVVGKHVALVAVGGYGRRELCPYSDIDLMFLCDDLGACGEVVEKVVRTLWDCGLQLGHSVRSPEECLKYMKDDDITAATLLESRFLAGSENLVRRFQEKSVNRYTKLYKEAFATAKLDCLRESVDGVGRTIFVTEPHVKEGSCCMRDIQHILWIERLRRQALDFDDIAMHGGFSFEEVRQLEDAYAFYLRVRCELHFLLGLRQDILEIDAQLKVAKNLGYEDDDQSRGIEKLISEYYYHARNVRNFSRFYLETKSKGTRFISKVRHRIFSAKISSFLSLLDGRLYLSEEPEFTDIELAENILQIFKISQENNAELSQSLCEWIRRKLSELPIDFTRSERIYRAFLAILAGAENTGRVLTSLHETGVLGRILPEFQKLYCLVNFDGHHQFTVDEHTLRTLRELDRIESAPDYPEPEFKKVLESIPDRLPLRLALLLHDIGKSSPGSHDAKGTEAAVVICERLGLDEKTIDTIEFLVYRHLAMFQFSDRVDFSEEWIISKFARLVRNREYLDMLYLLTYIDVQCVGPGTWTAWKGAQLAELYKKTRVHLETGGAPTQDVVVALTASGIEEEKQTAIIEHCKAMNNPAYALDIIPERMLEHMAMVEAFQNSGMAQVQHDQMVGCHQITFCERDRPHLFTDLTGLLLSEGLNILGARLYSREDGLALDCFQVEDAGNLTTKMSTRVKNLKQKLGRIQTGDIDIASLVSARPRRFFGQTVKKSLFPARVEFHEELSQNYSVIEVDAGDRPGLLYDLATTIADLGLDLRTAKVSTMIDRARDVFYLLESDGRKISDKARREDIKVRLQATADSTKPKELPRESISQ